MLRIWRRNENRHRNHWRRRDRRSSGVRGVVHLGDEFLPGDTILNARVFINWDSCPFIGLVFYFRAAADGYPIRGGTGVLFHLGPVEIGLRIER